MAMRDMKRTMIRTLSLVLAVVALSGCVSGMGELQDYTIEVKSRPAPPLEPLPVMRQFETFEYAAQDLRDPFSDPRSEESTGIGAGPRPDPDRRKEPLELFPLDGLDMVGTLGSGGDLVALVLDPEKVIHRVVVGNYLGQNDGRITAIYEDGIELVELVPDGTGKWLERRADIALDDN